jgi:hypothetical protein
MATYSPQFGRVHLIQGLSPSELLEMAVDDVARDDEGRAGSGGGGVSTTSCESCTCICSMCNWIISERSLV